MFIYNPSREMIDVIIKIGIVVGIVAILVTIVKFIYSFYALATDSDLRNQVRTVYALESLADQEADANKLLPSTAPQYCFRCIVYSDRNTGFTRMPEALKPLRLADYSASRFRDALSRWKRNEGSNLRQFCSTSQGSLAALEYFPGDKYTAAQVAGIKAAFEAAVNERDEGGRWWRYLNGPHLPREGERRNGKRYVTADEAYAHRGGRMKAIQYWIVQLESTRDRENRSAYYDTIRAEKDEQFLFWLNPLHIFRGAALNTHAVGEKGAYDCP